MMALLSQFGTVWLTHPVCTKVGHEIKQNTDIEKKRFALRNFSAITR